MANGICQCGCGKPTAIATRTRRERDQVAGKPLKYLLGHNSYSLPSLEKRFDARVEKMPSGCWEWRGTTTSDKQYPRLCVSKTKYVLAHRWSYERYRGEIPDGLTIDHLCRNSICVNPDHLEAVTNVVNVMRGRGAGALNAAKTHCKRGHEFTLENTYFGRSHNGNPRRQCKICVKEAYR